MPTPQATMPRGTTNAAKTPFPRQRTRRRVVPALFFAVLVPLLAPAQQTAAPLPATPEITFEDVASRLKAAQESTALDHDTQARIVEFYTSALDQLRLKQEWDRKAAEFEEQRLAAPQRIASIEEALRTPRPGAAELPPEDTPLSEIEHLLALAEADLVSKNAECQALDAEPGLQAERRKRMPELMADVARRVDEARTQSSAPPEPSASAEVSEARRMAVLARLQAAEAEKDTLDKELRSHEAQGRLLPLRIEAAVRSLSEAQRRVDELRQLAARSREAQARKAQTAAEQALALADTAGPAVRDAAQQLADGTKQLVEKRTGPDGMVRRIEKATRLDASVSEQLAKVSANLNDVKSKAATVQLSEAVGLLLRRHRRELPDTRADRAEVRKRNSEIAQMLFEQLEIQDERTALADVDGVADTMARRLVPQAGQAQRATAAALLRDLLLAKRENLDALISDYGTYVDLLLRIQLNQQQVISLTDEFSAYIQERVLWIRSGNPINLSHFATAAAVAVWLFDPGKWVATGAGLLQDAVSAPSVYLLALSAALLAFVLRPRVLRWGRAASGLAAAPSITALTPTVQTLAAATTMAVLLPAAMWFVSWRLAGTGGAFQGALAHGLARVALMTFTFESLRQILSPQGLAGVHFGWPAAAVATMRRYTTRLMPVSVIGVLVVSLLEFDVDERHLESLGRLAFMAAMFSYAVFAHMMMQPGRGPVTAVLRRTRTLGASRHSRLWYVLAVGIPIALAMAASAGYTFTAIRLAWRLHGSLCFGIGLVIVRAVVLRWLLLARRRLAREQLREQREALLDKDAGAQALDAQTDEQRLDLTQVDARVQRLVRSGIQFALVLGLWSIWYDVLPALGFFESVELWQTATEVRETVPSAGGAPSVVVREEFVPITLLDLGLAVLIGFMTVATARNLPSLLEMSVLRRLPLVPGERYAVTTLAGYAVAIAGGSLAFHVIGIGWGKVQWLIAAMGVGLGFGLQEIFANFISGLILLFERPIRVGDTVTIGGVTGTVSKIRIRATRIVDWDRKELIVPNKEFVTGQLVNWTLSDPILRVVVPVGIAYGSDTERAVRTLSDVARNHPLVLDDPEPRVLFLEFGESSLNLELRVFCPDIDSYLQVKHDLHMNVDKAFREAGIEIAFPQRDIRVRSIHGELPVRPRPPEGEE